MKLRILDICMSVMPNHWKINQIHQVIMDTWKRSLLVKATPSKLMQILGTDFLLEYVIVGLGLIGNKYKQHSI